MCMTIVSSLKSRISVQDCMLLTSMYAKSKMVLLVCAESLDKVIVLVRLHTEEDTNTFCDLFKTL
jgi:hypothetical protein